MKKFLSGLIASIFLLSSQISYTQSIGEGLYGNGGGIFRGIDGSAGAPSFTFLNETNTGFYRTGASIMSATMAGSRMLTMAPTVMGMDAGVAFGWYSSGFGTQDVILQRCAADTLCMKRATNAQTVQLFGTISGADSEFMQFGWGASTSSFVFTTKLTGAGTQRALQVGGASAGGLGGIGSIKLWSDGQIDFSNNANTRWIIPSAGHFLANTDNTNDIGAAGATRPRTVYAGTSVVTPTVNAATVTFTGFTFANIGTNLTANGMIGYCSDCTIAATCAGSGTGALAKRLNGVNVCN